MQPERISKQAGDLAEALCAGPVRAIGGCVYDCKYKPLMNTTALHGAIQELGRHGISIQRTDAGGSPTWDVAPLNQ